MIRPEIEDRNLKCLEEGENIDHYSESENEVNMELEGEIMSDVDSEVFTEQSDLSDNEEGGLQQIKDKAEKAEAYPVNREEIIDAAVAKMKDVFVKNGLMVTTAGSSSDKSLQDKDGDKQCQTKGRKR